MLNERFVYFIAKIGRNTLTSFLSFCNEKQSEILYSLFCQKLTLNNKQSDICQCEFKKGKHFLEGVLITPNAGWG